MKRSPMKSSLVLLALSGALSLAPSAFAHGSWGHGGGGYGGGAPRWWWARLPRRIRSLGWTGLGGCPGGNRDLCSHLPSCCLQPADGDGTDGDGRAARGGGPRPRGLLLQHVPAVLPERGHLPGAVAGGAVLNRQRFSLTASLGVADGATQRLDLHRSLALAVHTASKPLGFLLQLLLRGEQTGPATQLG